MTTTPTPPGERQPKETAPAFAAFRTYVDLGPARSTAKVAQACSKQKSLMDRWSARWSWVERVRQIESAQAATVDDGVAERRREIAQRQANEAQLHARATTLISSELVRRVVADPKELEKVETPELVRAMNSATRAHNRAVVTERLALGMTTEQAGAVIPREEAAAAAARLTDEELDAKLAPVDELAERRDRKAAG